MSGDERVKYTDDVESSDDGDDGNNDHTAALMAMITMVIPRGTHPEGR